MFEQHVMKKNQNYGCIIGGCDCMAAISENSPFLKISQQHQYSFNSAQILYYGRCELIVHVKIYFTKIDVVLSEILAGQKCIK
jgi:hypothetical protein